MSVERQLVDSPAVTNCVRIQEARRVDAATTAGLPGKAREWAWIVEAEMAAN